MKITKSLLKEMIHQAVREQVREQLQEREVRHGSFGPDGGMPRSELTAHLDKEREKKKKRDSQRETQKKRSAAKATSRGIEEQRRGVIWDDEVRDERGRPMDDDDSWDVTDEELDARWAELESKDELDECGPDMDREPRKLSVLFLGDEDRELGESSLAEGPGSGMDDFCAAYIEAALWSTNDESDESGGVPLDENYTVDDIDEETLRKMQNDCAKFQKLAGEMIEGREERAGHDFWLTRNGHGVGFGDGHWPEHEDALTELSKKFGEVWLYVGDDGQIHQM